MTIRHVIYTQEPGIDGTGITTIEKQQIRDDLGRVAPATEAPAVGATLREGPDGPAWMKDAVSADWFSNPNDAIAAAGVGGTVRFSPNTVYTVSSPVLLRSGVRLVGGDKDSSVVKATTGGIESLVKSEDTMEHCRFCVIENMKFDANGGPLGMDLRQVGHSQFDHLDVTGVGTGGDGIYFGGSNNIDGWTNTLSRSQIRGVLNGDAIHIEGADANMLRIQNNVIYSWGTNGFAINHVSGASNVLIGNDGGYGDTNFMRVAGGSALRTFANRIEHASSFAIIEGGSLMQFYGDEMWIINESPHTEIVVNGGSNGRFMPVSTRNPGNTWFSGSAISNHQFISPDGRVSGMKEMAFNVAESNIFHARTPGDAQHRIRVYSNGAIWWGNGSATPGVQLYRRGSDGDMQLAGASFTLGNAWDSGNLLRMGNYRLWVDGSGNLRMKNGVPTSDTDGTVVGGQS